MLVYGGGHVRVCKLKQGGAASPQEDRRLTVDSPRYRCRAVNTLFGIFHRFSQSAKAAVKLPPADIQEVFAGLVHG